MKNLELTTDQLKTIALLQFNNEPYFIIQDDDNAMAFTGDKAELLEEWAEYLKTLSKDDDRLTFVEWLCDNGNEIEEYDEDDYNKNYMVLTDEEADEKCKEYIIDTLWAFTPYFLAEQTDLDAEVFEAIQSNGKCEGNNDTIYNLINKLGSIDDFVSNAISADGRSHFMNSYDGHEHEETVNIYPQGDSANQTFYIYRLN